MKLEEGRYYNFIVVKTVTLPDASESLVLQGPDNKRYLLPLSFYNKYDLSLRDEVKCKVDKINCSGKVFLEPIHPYYREGEYCHFAIDSIIKSDSTHNQNITGFVVKDAFGNSVTGHINLLESPPVIGSDVNIRVERISKGRIYFSKTESREAADDLNEGETYDFLVRAIVKGDEGDEFYVVADKFDKEHHLPARYYNHYGFKPGGSFRGKIIRYSAGSPKTIEPENPWFTPGEVVEVAVGSYEPDETGNNFIVEVYDDNGFIYNVRMNEKPEKQTLRCTVLKIRKGRPVLVPVDEE
jgi:hypothetical protein